MLQWCAYLLVSTTMDLWNYTPQTFGHIFAPKKVALVTAVSKKYLLVSKV